MTTLPLALAALVAAVPAGARAAADPADNLNAASGTYQCLLTSGAVHAMNVTLALDSVPSQVEPGQQVSFAGTVKVTLPHEEAFLTSLMFAKELTIKAADFTMATTPGSGAKVSKVTGTPVTPSNPLNPFTLTAAVKMKAFQVPAGATDVSLGLPSQNTVANPFAGKPAGKGTPDKVAFTLVVAQNAVVKSRQMACWLGDDQQTAPLADIPVMSRAAAPPAGGGQSGGSSGPAAPAAGGGSGAATAGSPMAAAPPADLAQPAGTGGSALAAAPPADIPPADIPAADAPAAAAPVGTEPATGIEAATASYAAVPAATKDHGTFVPLWLLVLVGSLVPLGAVAYAVFMRQRLRAAAGGVDQPGPTALNVGGA